MMIPAESEAGYGPLRAPNRARETPCASAGDAAAPTARCTEQHATHDFEEATKGVYEPTSSQNPCLTTDERKQTLVDPRGRQPNTDRNIIYFFLFTISCARRVHDHQQGGVGRASSLRSMRIVG